MGTLDFEKLKYLLRPFRYDSRTTILIDKIKTKGAIVTDLEIYFMPKYRLIKVRPIMFSYYNADFGLPQKNGKDKFYSIDGVYLGKSLLSARLYPYITNMVLKHNIKDINRFKMLFISVIRDNSDKAREEIRKLIK